ncbi:MAG: MBL fold metallo-hydrolase [Chloroflexi bacterium]|nr:MBL fold metallo-hydrolase [Anaerolineaceae bacterium]NMB89324.1 MBL fold metallo-hydrolase [Chloroflexota bacterium]
MLEIMPFTLGSYANNTYLLIDPHTRAAVAIDPPARPQPLLDRLREKQAALGQIWLTHAHFDHIAGVTELATATLPPPQVALHPEDLPLWRQSGGAGWFGVQLDPGPEPEVALRHDQVLHLGDNAVEVRHTPGHTPGHVIFYLPGQKTVLCGDLIFYHSVGRTDLPGSNFGQLITSIRQYILDLPDETLLLSGHGQQTTVGEERRHNPFLD